MIESPLLQEIIAETKQEDILRILKTRFGQVPMEVRNELKSVQKEKKLAKLIDHAVVCRDLEAFPKRLAD